jgi:protein-L-isoaspartate(D-aspartate) O-methyltransferase
MSEPPASHNGGSALAEQRRRMLELLGRTVRDQRVIDAMAAIPRERFLPAHLAHRAYDDNALPIGEGQTISQPLIVALMIEAMRPAPGDHVLEVGTGSGYAAAVLSRLVRDVVTVERIPELAERARETLRRLQIGNITVFSATAHLGRKEDSPYDAILVSAGAPHVPRILLDQLAEGGRLIVPVGPRNAQQLVRATKTPHGVALERLGPCAFVPLIGEGAWRDPADSDLGDDVSRRSNLR